MRKAARELREQTERSNALHREYRDDPALLENYERFIAWQYDYLMPFYEDLRLSHDYAAAVDFVVSDLTGIGISERDRDIGRVVAIICRLLPGKALRALAAAMRLNAEVLDMNLSICRALLEERPVDRHISEVDYCSACRRATQLEQVLALVGLTGEVGRELDKLTRVPMIGSTLKAMRTPARLAGFAALHGFLDRGYETFTALDDVDRFLADLIRRMTDLFTRIYTEPLANSRQ